MLGECRCDVANGMIGVLAADVPVTTGSMKEVTVTTVSMEIDERTDGRVEEARMPRMRDVSEC